MKGALLILAWLLAAPAAAQPRTVAVQAGGELPGFDIAEAAPWLARQMDQAGIAGWHFAARDEGLAAPDRVEWRFDPLPYAGGGVRQFFPQPGGGVLKARAMVSAEARLYLGGQYQTTILGQEAVMGGTGDAGLARLHRPHYQNAGSSLARHPKPLPCIDAPPAVPGPASCLARARR